MYCWRAGVDEFSGVMVRWIQSHSDQRAGELPVGGGVGGCWCGAVVAVVVMPPRRDDCVDDDPPKRDAAAAASGATASASMPPRRAAPLLPAIFRTFCR